MRHRLGTCPCLVSCKLILWQIACFLKIALYFIFTITHWLYNSYCTLKVTYAALVYIDIYMYGRLSSCVRMARRSMGEHFGNLTDCLDLWGHVTTLFQSRSIYTFDVETCCSWMNHTCYLPISPTLLQGHERKHFPYSFVWLNLLPFQELTSRLRDRNRFILNGTGSSTLTPVPCDWRRLVEMDANVLRLITVHFGNTYFICCIYKFQYFCKKLWNTFEIMCFEWVVFWPLVNVHFYYY